MKEVIAFLPMRKGSQRVKNKNIREFSNREGGLCRIKLEQLLKVKNIDKIIVSTDDIEVKNIARSLNHDKIIIDDRPDNLASSDTSTDELINYVPSIIDKGVVLWTHVTSPFVDEKIYSAAIEHYFKNLDTNDSLMSVTKIQKFLWDKNGAINYDREKEKWPRTQTIEPLYEINSGIFLADVNIYLDLKDRIGKNPYLFVLDEKEAFDIDWENDFKMAEILYAK